MKKSSADTEMQENTVLTPAVKETVRDNLNRIFDIARPKGVTVMAATKTVPAEIINYAIRECGLDHIGENRVQELLGKYDALSLDNAELHFIGTLQPNKVKYIVGKVKLIHSLDSLKLAREIDRRSFSAGIVTDVLCEVNIGKEEAKGGIPEESIDEFIASLREFEHIRLRGMMVIGPHCIEKDDYRRFFAQTAVRYELLKKKGAFADIPILSMGMSDNYDLAIDYGATLIRPGTAVFGKRTYPTAVTPPSSPDCSEKL